MTRRTSQLARVRSAARRAFTLLEVVLAAVLGLIVVLSSLAFFTAMDKAKGLQARRLETNAELAVAHKVLQQAFRTLLMDDSPDRREDEAKSDIEKDIDDGLNNANERRDDAATMRFALQPDITKRDAYGKAMQTLDLTLTTPPVHYVTRSADAEAEIAAEQHQLAVLRRRQVDLWNNKSGKSSGSSSRSGSKSDKGGSDGAAMDIAGGAGGSGSGGKSVFSRERDPDASAAHADHLRSATQELTGNAATTDPERALRNKDDMEPPRAPGVRGEFELRPDDDPEVRKRLGPDAQQAWALWWRQIPPDEDSLLPETDDSQGVRDARLLELARASRTDVPEVKLLSGLKSAQWQVYRRRKMVPKMAAMHAKELPAYVEFKFETLEGRVEDWLFEVAWSYGPEPGTIVAVNDPINGGGLNVGGINITFGPDGKPIVTGPDGKPITDPNLTPGGGGKPTTGPDGKPIAGSDGGAGGTPVGGTPVGSVGGLPNTGISGGNGKPIVITLPGGGTITIPANAQPGGRR